MVWWKRPEPERKPEPAPEPEPEPAPAQAPAQAPVANVKDTLKSLSTEDFKNANKIPCLRSAILTGAGIGSTAGLVMYLSRRPLPKALNWGFAGFFVGSIFSWEQCRFRRRQGKLNVVNARQQYAKKD